MQSGSDIDRSQRGPEGGPVLTEPPAGGPSEWTSEQLFGLDRKIQEVGIRHEGHLYRLRRTKLGKLILTK